MTSTTFVTEGRPMPGRPVIAALRSAAQSTLLREGRAPLAVVAAQNALRHNKEFAAMAATLKHRQ